MQTEKTGECRTPSVLCAASPEDSYQGAFPYKTGFLFTFFLNSVSYVLGKAGFEKASSLCQRGTGSHCPTVSSAEGTSSPRLTSL